MQLTTFAALAALATGASAITCKNITVPVTISSRNAVFNLAVPQTNLEVTDLVANITQQGRNFTDLVLTGYNTVSGTYNISGQFCQPSSGNATNPTLQILTHGIGFDKGYWNLPFKGFNYSYVDVATDKYNYCTFAYDRLGIGNSSHGEPLNEIQSFIEVAALAEITKNFRSGSIPSVSTAFKKVVHVGHSFGSAQTYSFVNQYPDMSDGIVLTGFSMNATFVPFFAAGANFVLASKNQPLRFGNSSGTDIQALLNMYVEPLLDFIAPIDLTTLPKPQALPDGYIINSNAEANKYLFLKSKYFDESILTFAESAKQPVTPGELLTLGSVPMMNAFTKPVMVITGDSDVPYCGGDCFATGNASLASIPAKVAANFPNVAAANFTAYIQPNSGHGINLHYNATGAYNVINTFFDSKGLKSS